MKGEKIKKLKHRLERQDEIIEQYRKNSNMWFDQMSKNEYLTTDSSVFKEWKNSYDRYNSACEKAVDLERQIAIEELDQLITENQELYLENVVLDGRNDALECERPSLISRIEQLEQQLEEEKKHARIGRALELAVEFNLDFVETKEGAVCLLDEDVLSLMEWFDEVCSEQKGQ